MISLAWIALASLGAVSASATEPAPIKVIGRGIENRETHASLQLACVGPRLEEDSLERSCRTLQFLHVGVDGTTRFVGRNFTLDYLRPASAQIADHLYWMDLTRKGSDKAKFKQTREYFRGEGFAAGATAAVVGGLLFIPVGWPVVAIWAGVTLIGAPLAVDLITLPFDASKDLHLGGENLGSVDVRSLQSRAVPYWQVKALKISAAKFEKVLGKLEKGRDGRPIEPTPLVDRALAIGEDDPVYRAGPCRLTEVSLTAADAATEKLVRRFGGSRRAADYLAFRLSDKGFATRAGKEEPTDRPVVGSRLRMEIGARAPGNAEKHADDLVFRLILETPDGVPHEVFTSYANWSGWDDSKRERAERFRYWLESALDRAPKCDEWTKIVGTRIVVL